MKMHISVFISCTFLVIYLHLRSISGQDDRSEMGPKEIQDDHNFYSFSATDIFGNIVSLDKFKGKVSLVVNVASQCGYTDSHYSGLKLLQELLEETNVFNVLAFPCNQFGEQEPGNYQQIYDFAYNRMNANFPLFSKVNVIHQDVPEVWKFLIEKSGRTPTWNFWKYLVDHNGSVIGAWEPSISPDQLYHEIHMAVEDAVEARKEKESKPKKKKKKNVKEEF